MFFDLSYFEYKYIIYIFWFLIEYVQVLIEYMPKICQIVSYGLNWVWFFGHPVQKMLSVVKSLYFAFIYYLVYTLILVP